MSSDTIKVVRTDIVWGYLDYLSQKLEGEFSDEEKVGWGWALINLERSGYKRAISDLVDLFHYEMPEETFDHWRDCNCGEEKE